MTSRPYAEVIGDPIAHSKSPTIHNFWLKKLGIDAEYRATRVTLGTLGDYLDGRRNDPSWLGCNVTMPLKLPALRHADRRDEGASAVAAANLLVVRAGTLIASNTDTAGVLDALPVALMPAGSEVCLIGTGGAARAALSAMRARDVSLVLISARDETAGFALLREFSFGGCVRSLHDDHNLVRSDVIINATPLGMRGKAKMPSTVLDVFKEPIVASTVFDMVYDPIDTALLRAARTAGIRTVDGLEMLVGQAAAAFRRLFGQPAPREHDPELRALLTA
ncbi:MAG: shikimate dehydrogenase [Sphingomicrobium sp.]